MFSWTKPALAARAAIVQKILTKAFPSPKIPLDHTDTFTFLVAVILSAQCTDKRVNLITPKLFQVAGTPATMAAMNQKALYNIIKPCGLGPAKSKNLISTAKIILKDHQGQVPATRQALEALPGVGRKTASVILSQAFHIPAFPVDTHIQRSAIRWGLSRNGRTPAAIERDLCAIYPPSTWDPLHLQIIYYARAYCRAHTCKKKDKSHWCEICKAVRK